MSVPRWVRVLAALALVVIPQRATGSAPSPRVAAAVSFGATVIPTTLSAVAFRNLARGAGAVLLGSGVILGPAVGYAYGGLPRRAALGSGIRVAATACMIGGAALVLDNADILGDAHPNRDSVFGGVLFLIGGLAVAGSVVDDLSSVQHDVRVANDRRLALAPWRSTTGAPGLALGVRF